MQRYRRQGPSGRNSTKLATEEAHNAVDSSEHELHAKLATYFTPTAAAHANASYNDFNAGQYQD